MTSDEERRATILEAAAQVFATKGFSGATTAEIAKLAHVSKRDLYDHFSNKEGLLAAMVGTYSTTLPIAADLGTPDTADAFFDLLGKFGRRFAADLYQPHRTSLYRLAASEAGRVNELGKAIHEAGAGPVAASVQAFVGKAHRSGRAEASGRGPRHERLLRRSAWRQAGLADCRRHRGTDRRGDRGKRRHGRRSRPQDHRPLTGCRRHPVQALGG